MDNVNVKFEIKENTIADIKAIEGWKDFPSTIGDIPFDTYLDSVLTYRERAMENGGDTLVPYIPVAFNIILRAESLVKKAVLMSKNKKTILSKAEGFMFRVVAIGPTVTEIKLGDIVDIKNTQMLSFRPFIEHNASINKWAELMAKDANVGIITGIQNSEDVSKFGSGAAVKELQMGAVEFDAKGFAKLAHDEMVTIVEYAIIEVHNLNGVYDAFQRVHEVTA